MDYSLYKAEDFAADESFISYYLGNQPEAVAYWERWISHHPEMLDEVITAEHLLDMLYMRLPQEELDQEFMRMAEFLGRQQPEPERAIPTAQPRRRKLTRLLAAAALVSMVVLAGTFVFQRVENTAQQHKVEWVRSYNPAGHRSIIQLSDGTTVTLNANSSLHYPKRFTGTTREVRLKGEAFFEVAKDPDKRFIVRTDKLTTTVLGTRFNVRTHIGDKLHTQVALVEGQVKVSLPDSATELVLQPNQMATYLHDENKLTTSTFDPEQLTSWKDGTVLFEHADFKEIADAMKRNYGITLLNKSPHTAWSYSGSFHNTSYLTVVKSICYAKQLSYTVKQDTVIVH